jgi:hypothetical protein
MCHDLDLVTKGGFVQDIVRRSLARHEAPAAQGQSWVGGIPDPMGQEW